MRRPGAGRNPTIVLLLSVAFLRTKGSLFKKNQTTISTEGFKVGVIVRFVRFVQTVRSPVWCPLAPAPGPGRGQADPPEKVAFLRESGRDGFTLPLPRKTAAGGRGEGWGTSCAVPLLGRWGSGGGPANRPPRSSGCENWGARGAETAAVPRRSGGCLRSAAKVPRGL